MKFSKAGSYSLNHYDGDTFFSKEENTCASGQLTCLIKKEKHFLTCTIRA